jgi:hypothetical protein
MNEERWLKCADPGTLLNHLRGNRWDRQLRRFAVACCRSVEGLLEDPWVCRAVTVAERFLDGAIPREELVQVSEAAWAEGSRQPDGRGTYQIARDVARRSARHAAWYVNHKVVVQARNAPKGKGFADWLQATVAQLTCHADLLRDIIGNPFHRVKLDPTWATWNGGTAVRLAEAMYRDNRFDAMPVLGDALEEAGCTDAAILAHCRQLDGHVRGCWVVDLLLGEN